MNPLVRKKGIGLALAGWIILSVIPLRANSLETTGATEAIERSTINAPERTIQLPVFENGRFSGYTEEPLDPDRKPASVSARPAEEAPADTAPPDSMPQTEAPPSQPE